MEQPVERADRLVRARAKAVSAVPKFPMRATSSLFASRYTRLSLLYA